MLFGSFFLLIWQYLKHIFDRMKRLRSWLSSRKSNKTIKVDAHSEPGEFSKKSSVLRADQPVLQPSIQETGQIEVEKMKLWTNLSDFNYAFNENGQLRNLKDGSKFVFEVKPGDKNYNQIHYEALGKVIDEVVYNLLEKLCNLKRMIIPVDALKGEATGFFFASEDVQTNKNMLVLIHGSGVVRAGQWARRLIINDSLESGTQIQYIKRAQNMGFSIVVLNTNQNRSKNEEGCERRIRGSDCSLNHTLYVWDKFIVPSNAKDIAIVAHSAGGYDTIELAVKRPESFITRVFAVAFTDSAHSFPRYCPDVVYHIKKVTQNWVSSGRPLDEKINRLYDQIKSVSAGTEIHELTSHKAVDSVFNFIEHQQRELSWEEAGKKLLKDTEIEEKISKTMQIKIDNLIDLEDTNLTSHTVDVDKEKTADENEAKSLGLNENCALNDK